MPATTAALILYWFPGTAEEIEKSPLLEAPALVEAAGRCVAMEGIPPGRAGFPMAVVAEVAMQRPFVILTDRSGAIVGRIEGHGRDLSAATVERMVSDELRRRDEAMYHDLSEARRRANAGDKDAAAQLYRQIWDDRCLYPLAGQEAKRGLKEVGIVVEEPPPAAPPPDPNLQQPARKPRKDVTASPATR